MLRFRIADLLILVAVSALIFAAATAGVGPWSCLALVAAIGLLFVLLHRLGRRSLDGVLCPYCVRKAVMDQRKSGVLVCENCGSELRRDGRFGWIMLRTPADDRVWVGKFLPKLRRLRVELRPEPVAHAVGVEFGPDGFPHLDD